MEEKEKRGEKERVRRKGKKGKRASKVIQPHQD